MKVIPVRAWRGPTVPSVWIGAFGASGARMMTVPGRPVPSLEANTPPPFSKAVRGALMVMFPPAAGP